MIRLMSHKEAERGELPASRVHDISPYRNPAHVLAPPRRWLEAVVSGEYSWPFFRLRYKNLLRQRYAADPERFHALLDASVGGRELALSCHCVTERCHRTLAAEFLEHLRTQRPIAQPAVQPTRRLPPAREWAHSPSPGLVLATLIEPPPGAHGAHRKAAGRPAA
jgi:hypothetical protein